MTTETEVRSKRLTRGDVAKRLGVSLTQVKRYEDQGRLIASVEDGVHYFRPEDIERLAEEIDLATGGAVAILPRVMSHVEALHKARLSVADDYRAQVAIYREEAERLRTRCESLETKHLEVLRTMEDLATQRHKRELERLAFETDRSFRQTMLDRVSVLVPAVVNRIAGKQLMPSEDPRVLAIEALAESLSPAQLAAVQSSLAPEQAAVVADLIAFAREGARLRSERELMRTGAPAGQPAKTEGAPALESSSAGGDGKAS